MKVLVLDHFDSFVHNLARYAVLLGRACDVVRVDRWQTSQKDIQGYSHMLLSPGPGRPEDFPQILELLTQVPENLPILGICLGHQILAHHFGGQVTRALEPMHGQPSLINHCGQGIFAGLPEPFTAGRYHSLIAKDLKPPLVAAAWSEGNEIMAFHHQSRPIWGVQFHPESILTPDGLRLMEQFFRLGGA